MEELIVKYISGNATGQEKELVESWRKNNPTNERIYQEFRESWMLVSSTTLTVIPDKELVWKKITEKITVKSPVRKFTSSAIYWASSVAAVTAVVLMLGIQLMLKEKGAISEVVITSPDQGKTNVSLPDGTSVVLNSNSKLKYFSDYGSKNRLVKLEGQGYFNVKHNSQKSFEVEVNKYKVVVHGTTFDVNAYADENVVKVSLLKGSVSLKTISNYDIALLVPNQQIVLDKNSDTYILKNFSGEDECCWKNGLLRINGLNLRQIAQKLNHWYGVSINLKNYTPDKRYWMTIKTESLRESLELINKITPITYTVNGKEVNVESK